MMTALTVLLWILGIGAGIGIIGFILYLTIFVVFFKKLFK